MNKFVVAFITLIFTAPVFAEGDAGSLSNSLSDSESTSNITINGFSSEQVEDLVDQGIRNFQEGQARGEATRSGGPEVIQQDIRYSGEYSVRNVPAVSAPALTTTLTETCMGSSSMGASMVGFGFSFGTTWRDSACVRRLDAREVNSLGYKLAAKELMCESDQVREAFKRAGKPCFVDLPEEVRADIESQRSSETVATAPVASEDPLEQEGFDPRTRQ